MTLQISQQGKEYLKTAQTLLRTAKTMTDQAIAAQLRLLPTTTSGEPRRLRLTMQPKHWLDPLLALNASSIHELMGSFSQQLSSRPEI